MAAMVKQTLSQMLQATPTSALGMGARSADGAAASDTNFSNTLERKMSEPERPRESTSASSQNTRQGKESPPVQDKAPAADGQDASQEAKSTESPHESKETSPADKDAAKADEATDSAASEATAVADAAAAPTPDTLAATPAVLAAAPANDAADTAAAKAQAGMLGDKTQKAADVVAGTIDATKSTHPDTSAKGNDTRADLRGGDSRTGATDTAQKSNASATRENVSNFAAQLDSRMNTTSTKPADALSMMSASGTSTSGINPGLAAHLPGQATSTAATRPVLPTHLATPVESADWPDAVGNRVVWMSGRNESRAELILTPPNLGKLEISLTVTGDTTTAHFTAATPAAREALEQAMPRLREMLEQAGVTLADSNVNTAPQDQPGERGNGGQFAGGRGTGSGTGELMMENVSTSAGRWMTRGEGMIDTFA